jgi:hypothetical protein
LLAITERTDPAATLPAEFPTLPLYLGPTLARNSYAYLVGYPASFLSYETLLKNLYLLASPVYVNNIKGFPGEQAGDVISFMGTIAGQHGSSGGAVVNSNGELSGLITFFDEGGQGTSTANNILNAITVDYVNRDLKADTGFTIQEFLDQGDFLKRADDFMIGKGAHYQRQFANLWREKQDIVLPGVTY